MNEVKSAENVPYIVYESCMSRAERHIKRLWIALIVAITAIFACNAIWIWYINQYDFTSYEYQQDGQGVNIIGDRNGVMQYGTTAESESTD
jgi:hypothetical protein